jgi:hypothetical protein
MCQSPVLVYLLLAAAAAAQKPATHKPTARTTTHRAWDRYDNAEISGEVLNTAVTWTATRVDECCEVCAALSECAGFAFNGSCAPLGPFDFTSFDEQLGQSIYLKPGPSFGTGPD